MSDNNFDYSKVTVIEYNKKISEILNNLGRTSGFCFGVACNECPLKFIDKEIKCIKGCELDYTEEVIKLVMDYEIPIDWSTIEINTKMYVRENEKDNWVPCYFAKYDKINDIVYVFDNGSTSFSSGYDKKLYGQKDEIYMEQHKYYKLAE